MMHRGELNRDVGSGKRSMLLFVCAAAFSVTLLGTMVGVALPAVGEGLNTGRASLGWVVTAYFLIYGVGIPFYGRLGDLIGVRRPFLVGLGIVTVGSALCVASPTITFLVGGRVVQGVGAAAISALCPALITFAFPPGERGRAFGMFSAAVGGGAALGPILGGVATDAFGWRALFVVGCLLGLMILPALRILPLEDRLQRPQQAERVQSRQDSALGRLDWQGGLLFCMAMAATLLALTEGSRLGWASPGVLAALTLAVLSFSGWVWRQRTARVPFVSRALLADRIYLGLAAITLAAVGINIVMEVALPQLLSDANGLSATAIGFVLLPGALASALAGVIAGRFADSVGTLPVVAAGALIALVSLVGLSTYGVGAPAAAIGVVMVAVSIGAVLIKACITTAVSLVVSKENAPSGLAMIEMCFLVGASVGAALFSAALGARAESPEAVVPLYQERTNQMDAALATGYSDAFLVLAFALLIVLCGTLWLLKTHDGFDGLREHKGNL